MARRYRRVAVAQNDSAWEFIGLIAEAIFTGAAPAAIAARQVLLDNHAVAVVNAPAFCGLCADFGDEADILMSPDARRARKLLVTADVAAADAGDFHLEQGIVGADFRDGIFP